jgi:uncharacterized short protein YbdD (DUF466 family)
MRDEPGAVNREPRAVGRLASRLLAHGARLATLIRQLAGMPDYEAYLAHRRRHHPGAPVLSERDFFREHLDARYADGPTRCC